LPANPLTGADESPSGPSQRTWKRRHSPSPSTHTHTAINILLTPDNQPTSSLSADKSSYPSLKPARYMGTTSTKPTPKDRMPFLSVYRAHMMIMTIHCILAVDFPVFPRWQGKCEDFGTSLVRYYSRARQANSLMFSDGCWRGIFHLLPWHRLYPVFRVQQARKPVGDAALHMEECPQVGPGIAPRYDSLVDGQGH
jgi:hypothetical protein